MLQSFSSFTSKYSTRLSCKKSSKFLGKCWWNIHYQKTFYCSVLYAIMEVTGFLRGPKHLSLPESISTLGYLKLSLLDHTVITHHWNKNSKTSVIPVNLVSTSKNLFCFFRSSMWWETHRLCQHTAESPSLTRNT